MLTLAVEDGFIIRGRGPVLCANTADNPHLVRCKLLDRVVKIDDRRKCMPVGDKYEPIRHIHGKLFRVTGVEQVSNGFVIGENFAVLIHPEKEQHGPEDGDLAVP